MKNIPGRFCPKQQEKTECGTWCPLCHWVEAEPDILAAYCGLKQTIPAHFEIHCGSETIHIDPEKERWPNK